MYGNLHATRAKFDVGGDLWTSSGGAMDIEDVVFDVKGNFTNHGQLSGRGNNSITATDISHYGGMHVDGNLSMKAKNAFYASHNSTTHGSNGRVAIEAVNGPLDLRSAGNISGLSLTGNNIVGAKDWVTGRGRGGRLNVIDSLHMDLKDSSLNIDEYVSRTCSLSIVASAITVSANMYSTKNIGLKSTSGPIYVNECTIDGENTFLDSASHITATASTVRGRNHLGIKAVGDIINQCKEYSYQGAYGTRKSWSKGLFEGGKSMNIESTNGSVIFDASDARSSGNIRIKAKKGLQFKARTHTYCSHRQTTTTTSTRRSGFLGHKKTTTTTTTTTESYDTEYATSNLNAGGNLILETDGDLYSHGSTFSAGGDFIQDVKGNAFMQDLVLDSWSTSSTSTSSRSSSCWGLWGSNSKGTRNSGWRSQRSVGGTSYSGGRTIVNIGGNLTGRGQSFTGRGPVDIFATNIDLADRKLNHSSWSRSRSSKTSGLFGGYIPLSYNRNKASSRSSHQTLAGKKVFSQSNMSLTAKNKITANNSYNIESMGNLKLLQKNLSKMLPN